MFLGSSPLTGFSTSDNLTQLTHLALITFQLSSQQRLYIYIYTYTHIRAYIYIYIYIYISPNRNLIWQKLLKLQHSSICSCIYQACAVSLILNDFYFLNFIKILGHLGVNFILCKCLLYTRLPKIYHQKLRVSKFNKALHISTCFNAFIT